MSKQILVIAAPNLVLLGSQVPGNQPGKRASWLRVPPGKRIRIWPETAGNSRKRSETARKEMVFEVEWLFWGMQVSVRQHRVEAGTKLEPLFRVMCVLVGSR